MQFYGLSSWVIIRSLLSVCFSQINPIQKSHHLLTPCFLHVTWRVLVRGVDVLVWRGGSSWRPNPMYSHISCQISWKSQSPQRSNKKIGPALANSCSCFQKSIGYPVTAQPNYILDSLQPKRARTPAWRSVWIRRSGPFIHFLLFFFIFCADTHRQ